VSAKIQEQVPGCMVLVNEIPKSWVDYEIYCQLIPNTDSGTPNYRMIPRVGAFEVSFKGVVRINYKRYKNIVNILKATL
jgi:hypothetical protein